MSRIEPDSIMGHATPLLDGETVVAEFRADRRAYWQGHLVMAVVLGAVAGVILMWQGNPYPVAGPLGAAIAIGARAAYLASEALGETWRLTDRRLLGPGGRAIPLKQIRTARPFLGAVQLVMLSGDKHLIKYQSDAAAVAARIGAAASRGR
ncbi:hypothetical protein [Tabrizicola sp. YIM 78059]|uniref:hypothetical protein n=1 Tax=Tabrizicola sp. YIM 78059 TaxID=2529861 RepID=UPI0020BF07CF|nr:hypothetical protein [Tabrizicola sp. YIM 78059]